MKLRENHVFSVDIATEKHKRALKKPNEDRIIADRDAGIFILLDGVTRPHGEYESAPDESASLDISDILIGTVYPYLKENRDGEPEKLLRDAVALASEKILDYRRKKSDAEWGFYPSAVGIISILREGTLYYLASGDCLGTLIRGSSKIFFGRQNALEAVDMLGVTKAERYAKYCNHPESALSYTVFNGDRDSLGSLDFSFVDIHEADTLILASDGIANYVKFEKCSTLVKESAAEMIAASSVYDAPPYAKYADDKSVIKLCF